MKTTHNIFIAFRHQFTEPLVRNNSDLIIHLSGCTFDSLLNESFVKL